MILARKLQASRLCSLVKLVVNNSNNQDLHTVASNRSARLQGSLNLQALPASSAGPRLTWRSVVTLEQAQGQVRHCCQGVLCAQTTNMPCIRHCPDVCVSSQIDELNDKFVEARDEIEYAQEDAETTYFNESHKLAKDSVGVVTNLYQQILTNLSDADRGKLQRSMGMKMEQLKVRLLYCMPYELLG